jgi:hypothetical protein
MPVETEFMDLAVFPFYKMHKRKNVHSKFWNLERELEKIE